MIHLHPDLHLKDGLNWDLIRSEYLRRCSPEEREAQIKSLETPMRDRMQKAPKLIRRGAGTMPNATPPDKVEHILDYYRVGNKVTWISKETGVSQATVRKILTDAGIYDASRDRSRKR